MAMQPEDRDLKKQQLKERIVRDPLPDDIVREEERIRRRRLRRAAFAVLVLAILAGAFFIVRYIDSHRLCSTYDVIWQEPFDAAGGELVNFRDGVLRVTKNGIKYMDAEGVVIWDYGAAMSDPRLFVQENYAMVADVGGKEAYLIKKGGVGQMSVENPITAAGLSSYGVTVLMVADNNASRVLFFDNVCRRLDVEVRNAVSDENGVPVALAVSPDGRGLAFSMVSVTDGTVDTWLTFMNLDTANTGTDKVVGAFKYSGALFPEVRYLSPSAAVAFGDNGLEFFSLSDPSSPQLKASVPHERKPKSVFSFNDEACVIYENEDGNDELNFFRADGEKGLTYELDFEYEKIVCTGGYLVIHNESRCFIVGSAGQLVYNGSFTGNTYQMVVSDLHTLLQIGDYGMREVRLK